MAKYVLYTYQFAPLNSNSEEYPTLFENQDSFNPGLVMKTKLEVFSNLLKKDSKLQFLCSDQVYSHKILLNFNGIISLRIANNKRFIQEQDFVLKEIPNHPSCMVIIDNRENFQTIAIEKNSSFSSPDTVAKIMMVSFNAFLLGQMSLVGPRPEIPYYVREYRKSVPLYMVKHYVKPGITGWAQVNDLRGSDTSIEDRIKHDIYYIEHWSVAFDIKILFRTLTKGIFSKNAR